jgi:DNA invertase Pin-like site-specific DNA recombinase
VAEAVFDAVVQDEIQFPRLEPVVISQHPVYVVEHESGAKVTRSQLDAMMSEIRTGMVARVVVDKLERLGRSLTHLALILDELQRLSVSLVCSSQGIDTSGDNPAGRLQLGVLMAVAEFERSLIRERVNAGLRDAKGRGVL